MLFWSVNDGKLHWAQLTPLRQCVLAADTADAADGADCVQASSGSADDKAGVKKKVR